MGRLSQEQLQTEIQNKGYCLIDSSQYTNMQSRITIQCPKGHLIETCLADFRRPSFACPVCDANINFVNPKEVPEKTHKQRIVAFDQATEKFGVSIFDGEDLVYYAAFQFTGTMINRLTKIRTFIDTIVIQQWKPDFIIMEDIQYQSNGILTFKVLAMLLGILETSCSLAGVEYEVVAPNVWRKYAGTCGKNRREEKLLSVALVREKYGIKVSDDVAEAILIGRYAVKTHKKSIQLERAFGSM